MKKILLFICAYATPVVCGGVNSRELENVTNKYKDGKQELACSMSDDVKDILAPKCSCIANKGCLRCLTRTFQGQCPGCYNSRPGCCGCLPGDLPRKIAQKYGPYLCYLTFCLPCLPCIVASDSDTCFAGTNEEWEMQKGL